MNKWLSATAEFLTDNPEEIAQFGAPNQVKDTDESASEDMATLSEFENKASDLLKTFEQCNPEILRKPIGFWGRLTCEKEERLAIFYLMNSKFEKLFANIKENLDTYKKSSAAVRKSQQQDQQVIDELGASINHGYDLMQDLNHECADRMRTRLSVLNEMRDVLQIRLEDKLAKQASTLSYLDSFHSLESQIESLWKMVDENTDKENLDVTEIQKAYEKVMVILTPVKV